MREDFDDYGEEDPVRARRRRSVITFAVVLLLLFFAVWYALSYIRADQTAKIKGMFVRPEQVADLVARHPEIARARVIAERDGEMDVMTVQVEAAGGAAEDFAGSVSDTLKLKGRVEIVPPGSLPNDGKVIEDRRSYD